MEHEVTANTPFIENPQMGEWKSPEPLVSPGCEVVCDLVQTPIIHPLSDPPIEIFRSTVHEVEQWYTDDDLEALEPEFLEETGNQPMLSVKDDTGERLPLYCQYVNGRLQTVYPLRADPYSFDEMETYQDLTSSSDL